MHLDLSAYRRRGAIIAAVALASSAPLSAQSRITLPAGSVIIVRTTTPLQSATARTGQTFETNVEESVGVDDYAIIPSGSRIRGRISVAKPATRSQSGVIEVVFDRITFADGSSMPISGKLTSTDSAERRQIKADPNAHVVLVGGRGGIGAAIAGAGASSGANNILAALGGLLSEGQDVDMAAGAPLAVELERAVALRGRSRLRGNEANTIYTAADRIRQAQQSLAQMNYYRGAATGVLDDATRRSLFQFQVDRGLSGTGNLDGRTAQALGLSLDATVAGTALSASDASSVRRDAQSLVARLRSELGITSSGRIDQSRAYAQADLELWFAQSAFADNASLYEQIVRTGRNENASTIAGRALVNAARRVDAAMQAARTSAPVQSIWSGIRRSLTTIDTPQ
ncbi:MAG: peptidoglycan-binding protein [Gemmatimonadota bacterium]|nr:peptidoglycan-binding protein [Gemmatimonadota bacterium]